MSAPLSEQVKNSLPGQYFKQDMNTKLNKEL